MSTNKRTHSNLVYFQQNARFVGVIAVVVLSGAVGPQLADVKVAHLLVRVVNRVVTRTVHPANAFRPIFIVYNTQQCSGYSGSLENAGHENVRQYNFMSCIFMIEFFSGRSFPVPALSRHAFSRLVVSCLTFSCLAFSFMVNRSLIFRCCIFIARKSVHHFHVLQFHACLAFSAARPI